MAGLWALAVADPMLQNISSGPEALTHLGAGAGDLILALGLLVLAPPTVLLAVEVGIGRFAGKRVAWFSHAAFLGLLVGLLAWRAFGDLDLAGLAGMTGLVLVTVLVCRLYLRAQFARAIAGTLAFAAPVVIVVFLISEPVRSELGPYPEPPRVERIASDTPVVLLVFDEWPLATIESAPGEIDETLFPGMAELARRSTWYPNATTDARMTRMALPTIMTGLAPDPGKRSEPPSGRAHPANLCAVLGAGGYAVTSMEPYSNFCGGSYDGGARLAGLIELAGSEGIAPGRVVGSVTGSLASLYPPVSMWSGRQERLSRAIDGLEALPRTFTFVHSLLPHFPWRVGPEGQEYDLPEEADAMAVDGQSQWVDIPERVDYAHQRLMLQARYVDGVIATMIERLRRRGEWDDALVIVTADHGAEVRPGEPRRDLSQEAFASIGSIPMFVKFPGQGRGITEPSFARTVDIAATVHRELGIESALTLDGEPLRGIGRNRARSPGTSERSVSRKRPGKLAIQAGPNRFELSPAEFLRQREDLVAERNRLFGSGTLYALARGAELLGSGVESISGLEAVDFEPTEPALLEALIADYPANMVVLDATVTPSSVRPGDRLLVSHGGRVLATARAYRDDEGELRVTVVLPPSTERRDASEPLRLHRDRLPGR